MVAEPGIDERLDGTGVLLAVARDGGTVTVAVGLGPALPLVLAVAGVDAVDVPPPPAQPANAVTPRTTAVRPANGTTQLNRSSPLPWFSCTSLLLGSLMSLNPPAGPMSRDAPAGGIPHAPFIGPW